jgi:hypothetical protein
MTSMTPTTEDQMLVHAQEIKRKVEDSLRVTMGLMDLAKAQGMTINFNIGLDHMGRHTPTVTVTKPLA